MKNDVVQVWVDEDLCLFKVNFRGEQHSAVMPEDPDSGDEPKNVQGDVNILIAATHAWSGEPYFEMTADEFSKASGGHWAPPS